ncbi:MAG: hypothetical protein RL338_1684 [Chloroflexota bacterium]
MHRLPAALLPASTLLAALLLAGCAATGPTGSPGTDPTPGATPAGSAAGGAGATPSVPGDAGAGGGGPCATLPEPGAEIDGWPAPGMISTTGVYPVIVSSELACGENRLVFTFLDAANEPQASPDRRAAVAIYALGRDPATPTAQVEATFAWAIEGERGLYVAPVSFDAAGVWGADFATVGPDGTTERIRVRFDVKIDGSAVRVDEPAPSVTTPTLADVGGDVARISTDTEPRPEFYETSVDEALDAGEPFLLVFATPAFCASAQCGPLLDTVKAAADEVPDLTVINVEPYRLAWVDGRLQPDLDASGALQVVDAVRSYGMLTEPWIYVVDADGYVAGSFEGIATVDELVEAMEEVLADAEAVE